MHTFLTNPFLPFPLSGNMKIQVSSTSVAITILVVSLVTWAWGVLDWVWLKPKKLERFFRQQGLTPGKPFRILFGDVKENEKMVREARDSPLGFSHDLGPRIMPFLHQTVMKHGKNSFTWRGPIPRLTIMNPEQIREVLTRIYDFQKPNAHPLTKLLACGMASHEGEEWAKHRKIINPAFHVEKLKVMVDVFYRCSNEMIYKWEKLLSTEGSCDLDVWPDLQSLSSDVISHTTFGRNYEEGKRILDLLKELANLTTQIVQAIYIPGWRFLPTKTNRRMKAIDKEIQASLKNIIREREKAMKAGETTQNDLLGILMESNFAEIQQANNKSVGMSINDVIQECKLFYFVGQETSSAFLVWTMILLSKYPDWQAKAREEVLLVFGDNKPDFDGLNRLKTLNMILYEVLRLYPPVVSLTRKVHEQMMLGNLTLPAGVHLLLPILLVHHDCKLWGHDALEFKPERFSDGISNATKNQAGFFPFGWGPRICIGQAFALVEAKMALAIILRRFSFELSPFYNHCPRATTTLQPENGAPLILRKL